VRVLAHDEDDDCSGAAGAEAALLAIAAVHPLRTPSVQHLLDSAEADWRVVDRLVREGRLERIRYRNRDFYRARRP
jgi:hypothetical protein